MARACLNVTDFTPDEVRQVLALAGVEPAALGRPLDGRGAALIFEKPSTRTRHSMEMAVVQLGGHPVYTKGDEVGLDERESVEDVTRVLDGYHGLLAARVFEHDKVERMAATSELPVVNLLSNHSHPLQGFADALTMQQLLGDLAGKTVAYVGDYNNVARTLGEIVAMLGAHLRFASPVDYGASDADLEHFLVLGAASAEASTRPIEAVAGAHAVHTDTWVSMGDEREKDERRRVFEGFTVDETMMASADRSAAFMHCLPAYRGFEVSAGVADGPRSAIFQQAHNRLHSARAVMAFLLGVRP